MFYRSDLDLEASKPWGSKEPITDPTGDTELVGAYFRETWFNQLQLGEWSSFDEIYEGHNRKLKETLGVDLPNPVSMLTSGPADLPDRSRFDQDYQQHKRDGGDLTEGGYFSEWRHKDYLRQLDELAAKNPEKRADIIPQVGFDSQAAKYRGDVRRRQLEAWERSDQGIKQYILAGAGMLAGGLADPINWITAPVGFAGLSGAGAKGIAMAITRELRDDDAKS